MNGTNPGCSAYVGGIGMLVLLITGLALGGDSPRGRCQLVPETWTPSLEQVQENMEEGLAMKT